MQMGQAQKQLPQQALHLRHGETLLGDEDLEPQRLSDCGALASGQHTKKKTMENHHNVESLFIGKYGKSTSNGHVQ